MQLRSVAGQVDTAGMCLLHSGARGGFKFVSVASNPTVLSIALFGFCVFNPNAIKPDDVFSVSSASFQCRVPHAEIQP
jgi:hypothetical protein